MIFHSLWLVTAAPVRIICEPSFIFKHYTSVSQLMCCHPHLKWWRKKFLLLTVSQYLVSILKAVFLVRVITCSDNCGNVNLTATLLKMTQTMDCQGCQPLSEKWLIQGNKFIDFFVKVMEEFPKIFSVWRIPGKKRKVSNLQDHEN